MATPRIIPRDQHNISRKQVSPAALKVLYRLHEEGFGAFLVGGAVRDLLLGIQPKDFDVATDATPEQVKRLFRNCRLIGRRFRLAHVIFGREIIEVATFRGSGESSDADTNEKRSVDGRILRDNVWGNIEEDALRRDFRVNAMYYDISDFSVRDYAGGMQDLHNRVLTLIGDPVQRYREDPVRMLRAVRLAAKLGFSIDDSASSPFAALGSLLADAPPARLFDESLKLFLAGYGFESLRELRSHGLLQYLFPVTCKALVHDVDGHFQSLLQQGLRNTDQRVHEGKSVTPAFLFALLLWGEVRNRAEADMKDVGNVALAWQQASGNVIAEQARRVSIPRRFTYAMEEIWALQLRFPDCRRKRAMRLLEHPRFRAAFDFLLLRAGESEQLAGLGQWWSRAQEIPRDQLAQELESDGKAANADGLPRKRTRRRKKKPSGEEA